MPPYLNALLAAVTLWVDCLPEPEVVYTASDG